MELNIVAYQFKGGQYQARGYHKEEQIHTITVNSTDSFQQISDNIGNLGAPQWARFNPPDLLFISSQQNPPDMLDLEGFIGKDVDVNLNIGDSGLESGDFVLYNIESRPVLINKFNISFFD